MGDGTQDEQRGAGPTTARLMVSAGRLDRELTGALPCVVCGYDLKGLSIRGNCPECGCAVRATILYKVDPRAEEFQPLHAPPVLAWSLVLWSCGALVAALACWFLRVGDAVSARVTLGDEARIVASVAVAAAGLSWLGSLAMIRPGRSTPWSHTLCAIAGSLAYLPLLWAMWTVLLRMDPHSAPPYFEGSPRTYRIILRLIAGAAMVAVILGLRPIARDLVKRSMVMRTGRVDRQTLLLLAATVVIAMVGDTLRFLAAYTPGAPAAPRSTGAAGALAQIFDPVMLNTLGTLLIALGSCLFTLGLVGALIDSWRIGLAIRMPSPSLRQLLGEDPTDTGRRSGSPTEG